MPKKKKSRTVIEDLREARASTRLMCCIYKTQPTITWEDMTKQTANDLFRLRNFGAGCLAELNGFLVSKDLTLTKCRPSVTLAKSLRLYRDKNPKPLTALNCNPDDPDTKKPNANMGKKLGPSPYAVGKKKTLKSVLKKTQKPKRKSPVWKGPEDDGPQGGVTQSLLSRFVCCRERFRLKVVEGLGPVWGFNKNIEYGNMFHLCAEQCVTGDWQRTLMAYTRSLCRQYPLDQEQIVHWYNVCKIQFPLYLAYWKKHGITKHGSKKKRTDLLQEVSFHVPYELPSGRTVYLRGKWDGVFLEGKGIWLEEHKTKGQILEEQIRRQLNFDLQTMTYLVALQEDRGDEMGHLASHEDVSTASRSPIKGVMYNVVRRPLSGGKGSIRRHKATAKKEEETLYHFYVRVAEYIIDEPETYFMRWQVEVSQADIDRFKQEFLDPCLEQLCDWWDGVSQTSLPQFRKGNNQIHYRLPYGIYNVLAEGGSSDLDEYLATGSEVGLARTDNLFPELD